MSEELEKKEENVQTGTVQQTEQKGLSIASMVLGIVSMILCIPYLPIPCAILAIIFSIVGRKKGGRGMAITGMVLGIISLAIYAIMIIFVGAALTSLFSAIGELNSYY